jgi:hypothetical protein
MFGETAAAHAPALATHAGKLWCMYVGTDGKLYYAEGTNDAWNVPKLVSPSGLGATQQPMLAELDGILHAVYIENYDQSHDLIHCQYDDTTAQWVKRTGVGQHTDKPVALAAYDNRLFCVFTADNSGNSLLYTTWSEKDGWDVQRSVGEASWGTPALYVWRGQLRLLFAENNKQRRIQETMYDGKTGKWSRTGSPPPEAAEFGVNAATGSDRAFMSFLERDNTKGNNVYVSINDGKWLNHEDIHQQSRDTPAVAVLNGVATCAFVARSDKRVLLWAQRRINDIPSESWMDHVPDGTAMSNLSIPGTHDSCAVSIWPFVPTQTMPVVQQLDAGVRFLDLRCRLNKDVLYMYHGIYYLQLTLEQVLHDIYGWLDRHPREALVVMIKQEGDTVDSTMHFDQAVALHTQAYPAYWYLDDRTPTLKEVRRKMILLRRYDAPSKPIGIDVSAWTEDGSRFDILNPSGVKLTAQDHWDLTQGRTLAECVDAKWKVVAPLLDDASNGSQPDRWYLNYTSAVAKGTYIAEPRPIAVGTWDLWIYTPGVNSLLRDHLTKKRTARYGIVIMDFPEAPADDLIESIYQANSFARSSGPAEVSRTGS